MTKHQQYTNLKNINSMLTNVNIAIYDCEELKIINADTQYIDYLESILQVLNSACTDIKQLKDKIFNDN